MTRLNLITVMALGILYLCPYQASAQLNPGADLIVGDLTNPVNNFGRVGDITAYAFGTIACNAGDQEVNWYANNNMHPVLTQQIYRLKNGCFEQVGMSWARHGFLALANDYCGFGCTRPSPFTGETLGTGCSHPDSADVNGYQYGLGPRGHINPYSGGFSYPFNLVLYPPPPAEATIGRRLQIHDADLDPALNVGALYFAEAQYATKAETDLVNRFNNVSYRPAEVSNPSGQVYDFTLTGSVIRESPAIHAWKANDPSVTETIINVPGDGRFILAAKATQLSDTVWHYEYALYNQNSDRCAGSFAVPVAFVASNIGFHDINHHSGDGEPRVFGDFSGASWDVNHTFQVLSWETDSYDTDPQANALRWGTVYNFRFDVSVPPTTGQVTLGLFAPGSPTTIQVATVVPGEPVYAVSSAGNWAMSILALACVATGALVIRRRSMPTPLATR